MSECLIGSFKHLGRPRVLDLNTFRYTCVLG